MKRILSYILLLLLSFTSLTSWANTEDDLLDFLDRSAEEIRIQVLKNEELVSQGRASEGVYFYDLRYQYNGVTTVSSDKAIQLNQTFSTYRNNAIFVLMPLTAESEIGRGAAMSAMQMYVKRVANKLDPTGAHSVIGLSSIIGFNGEMYSFPTQVVGLNANQEVANSNKSSLESITCKQLECFINAIGPNIITSSTSISAFLGIDAASDVVESQIVDATAVPLYFQFKYSFNTGFATTAYGHEGMLEYFNKFSETREISFFIPSGRKIDFVTRWAGEYYWIYNRSFSAKKEYTENISYADLWIHFSWFPDEKEKVEKKIYALYPEEHIKSFLDENKASFSIGNINTMLRICQLAKLIGKDKWDRYHMLYGTSAIDWNVYLRNLITLYESGDKGKLFAKIEACTTPGQIVSSVLGMSYLLSIMDRAWFNDMPLQLKLHALDITSEGEINDSDLVGMEEEEQIVTILSTISTKEDSRLLFTLLKRNNYNILQKFIVGIDGNEVNAFAGQLMRLYAICYADELTSMKTAETICWGGFHAGSAIPAFGGASLTEQLNSPRQIYFNSVGKIKFFLNYKYTFVQSGAEGQPLEGSLVYDKEIEPFTPIYMYFYSQPDENLINGLVIDPAKPMLYKVPAFFFLLYNEKLTSDRQILFTKELLRGVALVLGAGELSAAEGVWALLAGIDVYFTASAIVLSNPDLQRKIATIPGGADFLFYHERCSDIATGVYVSAFAYKYFAGYCTSYRSLSKSSKFDNALGANKQAIDDEVTEIEKRLYSQTAEAVNLNNKWLDDLDLLLGPGTKNKILNWIGEGLDQSKVATAFSNATDKASLFSKLDNAKSLYHRKVLIKEYNIPGVNAGKYVSNSVDNVNQNININVNGKQFTLKVYQAETFQKNALLANRIEVEIIEDFGNGIQLVKIKPDTKLYRVYDGYQPGVNTLPKGNYWTFENPSSLSEVIGGCAVQPEWNSMIKVIEIEVPSQGIYVWRGLAAKQPLSNNESITNYFLQGGTEQLIFDINQNSISLPTITKSIKSTTW